MFDSIKTLIESRNSVNYFDAKRPVSADDVHELVRLATLAPSAYHLQNWKFVAVQSDEAKQRLKALSFDQQKVVDASVTFIICGTLAAHRQLEHTLQSSIESGILNRSVVDSWVSMASNGHETNLQLQRDEAIRSASLAAMTLMLAAQGMGLVTCAMSGFDAQGVMREFELAPHELPVMLITVGYPADGNWPQKPRKPIADVLTFA